MFDKGFMGGIILGYEQSGKDLATSADCQIVGEAFGFLQIAGRQKKPGSPFCQLACKCSGQARCCPDNQDVLIGQFALPWTESLNNLRIVFFSECLLWHDANLPQTERAPAFLPARNEKRSRGRLSI